MTALLAAAFAAGLVATVNPCGFAMLPAYLGYFLGASERDAPAVRRFPMVGLAVSAGFLAVFALAGVVITAGLRSAVLWVPWLALAVGVGLIVLGVGMLLGRRWLPSVPAPGRGRRDRSLTGMFVFGVSYAVASLSCTMPIFLSLVTGSIAAGTLIEGVLAFVVYGMGMAAGVLAITATVALGRDGLVRRVRAIGRHLDTVSGVVMLAAGTFIVWYWVTVLSAGGTAIAQSRFVRWVERLVSLIAETVADRPAVALIAVVIVIVLGLVGWRAATSGASEGGPPGPVEGSAKRGD